MLNEADKIDFKVAMNWVGKAHINLFKRRSAKDKQSADGMKNLR